MNKKQIFYCGFVAIVGKPNVGKSTLLNKLLGQKISITSKKPQTTRHQILGIHTEGVYQVIYIDTPGLHVKEKKLIDKFMNRSANNAIKNVELVIFVVESTSWTLDDEIVINKLQRVNCPIILAINKVDNLTDKKQLLPYINFLSQKIPFYDIIPICAYNGMNIDILSGIVRQMLPKSVHRFPEGYITDRSKRFMASEIIREKLMRFLGDELPYSVTVKIERFTSNNRNGYDINGLILVQRNSQKKIVIGNNGMRIRTIGIKARQDMETMFETKIYLKLWVNVKLGWSNNEHSLRILGYIDNVK